MSAATGRGGIPPSPGAVAHSTSRRTRSGARRANSWASAPPNEYPSTSADSSASASITPRTISASRSMRSGHRGRWEPPTPGASKAISSRPPKCCSSGSHMSRLAPIPVINSSGRPRPLRPIRNRRPAISTKPVFMAATL